MEKNKDTKEEDNNKDKEEINKKRPRFFSRDVNELIKPEKKQKEGKKIEF